MPDKVVNYVDPITDATIAMAGYSQADGSVVLYKADKPGWIATATNVNAAATASNAGVADKNHIIHSITASFSQAVNGARPKVQLLEGVTVRGTWYFDVNTDDLVIPFESGVLIGTATSVSAVLDAGGVNVIGAINLHGETR